MEKRGRGRGEEKVGDRGEDKDEGKSKDCRGRWIEECKGGSGG